MAPSGPLTEGRQQVSAGPPSESHRQVLGLRLRPRLVARLWLQRGFGLVARLWLELRHGLRPLSLTSGSQDVDGLVAFLVGALCRPGGFLRKETF